jgi:hypothetical protein
MKKFAGENVLNRFPIIPAVLNNRLSFRLRPATRTFQPERNFSKKKAHRRRGKSAGEPKV